MCRSLVHAVLPFLLAGPAACAATPRLAPYGLRTEYRTDPLGLDVLQPRLSWKVRSSERAQAQSSYRVLVASDPARLARDEGDLWDSGRVESDETIEVVYAGTPLASYQPAWWKVGVWEKGGEGPYWSGPALWSMGVLEKDAWKAQWIGYDRPRREVSQAPDFTPARWIGFAGDPPFEAPKGRRYFRGRLSLPAGIRIVQASVLVTADDRFSLWVNGSPAGENDAARSAWDRASDLNLGGLLRPGENILAFEVENGASGPAGLIARIAVSPAEGAPVVAVTGAGWKAAAEPAAGWRGVSFDDSAWAPARELAPYGDGPWGRRVGSGSLVLPPPRYLRREFSVEKPLRRATVHAAALGLYELRLGGERVGRDYFTPGWTDYDRRVYTHTYDVTTLVRQGRNALGAILADGWYAGYVGFGHERDHYGRNLRLLAQLRLEFADGTVDLVTTGPDWKASTGPLLEADFLMGESYDARLEMPGWDRPGFDDSSWEPVAVTGEVSAALQAHPGAPVRELDPIEPIGVREPRPGQYVLDMGQNFAGVVRIRVRGQRGRRVTLRFAERLNPDGTIYTANLRSARATDTYVLKGTGEPEVWQPRFTFHGFQYVEVTGWPGKPGPEDITGIPLSSDTPVAGRFECSDAMVDQLFSNIYWTQRANFIDIPTDCPQRDERLGWTGDAQVYIRTASLIADTQAFFTKWLVDLSDAQRADGQFPMIAPLKSRGPTADGGPAWADAGVICPWTIYEVYGDRRLLARHYESMERFVEFTKKRSTPELLPPEKFHSFGDWLNIEADTPREVIYTAYFASSTSLLARAAEALGKREEAARYGELYGKIKEAFNKAYVGEDGRIRGDTQTSYVLALAFDLVDGEKRELAARYLVEDIEKRDWHLSTGFIGTKDLMLVLARIGRNDVAYRLLHNTTFPSWGFSIRHGATTIWERWNGWSPEKGFADPGMNSFAHYSFGAVYQWIFENIGGIRSRGPAFKHVVIRPQPGGGIRWARVSYDSTRGPIESSWKREDGAFRLDVTVPANTTATVHVPAAEAASVTESGKPAADAQAVRFLRIEPGAAVYEVGSGRYAFRSRLRAER